MNGEALNRFSFGDFELDAVHRLLRKKGGDAVNLNPKTLDLLLTLIENHGRIVSKSDLLDKIWENQFVEENNLTVHVAALRKALGEKKNDHRFIVTVPGKGYGFVAKLNEPAKAEVVVERRKFERIVIEEEFEEHANGNGRSAANGNLELYPTSQIATTESKARLPASLGVSSRRIAVAALVALIAVLGGSGFAFRERLGRVFSSSPPFVEHRMRQLTTNGKVGKAALSPDGKLFAYTIDDLGQKSLWLGNVDGGNHLLLRPAAEAAYGTLAFSPDNGHLYFSIRDDKNPEFALYKIPAPGGVATKVGDGIDHFALSPDGNQIATARQDGDTSVLVISALDGSQSRDIAFFPSEHPFVYDTISWSADSARIAMSVVPEHKIHRSELAIVDVATGEVRRVPLTNYRAITKTAWLSDGTGLAVTAIEETSHSSVPQYRIVYVSYPGGESHQITTDRSNYGESWHNDAIVTLSFAAKTDLLLAVEHRQLSNVWVAPVDDLAAAKQVTFSSFGKYDGLWGMDWTPDGALIYTTSDTQSQYLARMNADGSHQKAITAPEQVDSVLTVSNDGRYILFHSNRISGDFDIWRTEIDGSNPKQLTFGGKGFHPAPSPDGKWVYYKSWLSGMGELRRIPIDGGESEAVNDKETSWMSFSPDGRYLAASYISDRQRLAIFSAETNAIIRQFDIPQSATLYMGTRWTPDSKAVTYRDNAYGYWLQPMDGGEPQRLEGLPKEKLYNFSWSKDGKWFAFVRGQEIRDVVLLADGK